jgi:hypothetical protein
MVESGLFMHVDDVVKDSYGNCYSLSWPGEDVKRCSPSTREYYCVIEKEPPEEATEYYGELLSENHINCFYGVPLTNRGRIREGVMLHYTDCVFTFSNPQPIEGRGYPIDSDSVTVEVVKVTPKVMGWLVEMIKSIYLQRFKDYVKP